MTFRKNSANANMAISTTSGGTGYFGDQVKTDYLVSTDEANYSFSSGASSGVTIQFMSVWAVKGITIPITDSASISEATPARLIGRKAVAIFPHM
jgi:hypothetical protein